MLFCFQTMCISVSIITLCAISVERWYAICRPLSFHSNTKRARIIIVVIWIVSIGVATPEFLASRLVPYRRDTIFRYEYTLFTLWCKRYYHFKCLWQLGHYMYITCMNAYEYLTYRINERKQRRHSLQTM